ncbi:MAG: cyclopropane-fatty-acyl-phospholipid synthase family protein [Planctomycetota bacterium]
MTTLTHELLAPSGSDTTPIRGFRQRLAKKLVTSRLDGLADARVRIEEDWSGELQTVGRGESVQATIRILDPSFYTAVLSRGSLGAAEAWIDGAWTCDDLTALVRAFVRNRSVLEGVDDAWLARFSRPLLRLFHQRRKNTETGSRQNIAAHYDLGNEFFEQMLDETMTYSSGIFESEESTLEEAQFCKLDRLCRKLDLQPTDHLVEIGTGWGSMAIHAAKHFGCRVTTTTISAEQKKLAEEKICAEGLEGRIEVVFQDYRKLEGTYDKLVSCEMIEAVGADHLDVYSRRLSELVKPDGILAIQAILIDDASYARALKNVDFIKRYIFPGSFIPSSTAILNSVTRSSDLRLRGFEEFGNHYARTLRTWRERLYRELPTLRDQGLDDRFLRLFEYYLCYCEGGFAERFLGVGQFVFSKPQARPEALLAPRGQLRAGAVDPTGI